MKHMKKHHEMHEGHHGAYEHEVDLPKKPKKGHAMGMHNCNDFKSDSADQAFGQAGKAGTLKDEKKIHAQFLHVYDDSNSGY